MQNYNYSSQLKNNKERSVWAIVGLQIVLCSTIISFLHSIFQLYVVNDLKNNNELDLSIIDYSDMLEVAIPFLSILTLIIAGILFLNWFRRAYGNLHRMQIEHLAHTEVHSVWAFIVPIISLWRPYVIAKEIDLETKKLVTTGDAKQLSLTSNPLIGWWWAFFIIGNIMGDIAGRIYPDDYNLSAMEASHILTLFTEIIHLAAIILAIQMVKKIALNETKLWRKHNVQNANELFM